MARVVFLDTNIFMHCQPVREIPWRDIVGADEVILMATRVVVSELDEQKDSNPKQNLRDRARRALQEIERWTMPATLREGVTASYYAKPLAIYFAARELRQDRADDVLIATILQYRSENPDADLLLVTNDTGPRLTARHVGIDALAVPEQYRLSGQPDPLEEENKRLRNELQKLQRAHPAPRVQFTNGTDRLIFVVRPEQPFNASAIAAEVAELRKKHRPLFPPSNHRMLSDILSDAALGVPPRHEYDRYNAELQVYFANYEQHMRQQWDRQQADRWTVELALSLHNNGGAPATDMDVEVTFHAKADLLDSDPRDDQLTPPTLPPEPQTQLKRFNLSVMHDLYDSQLINLPLTNMHRTVSDADIETDGDGHRIRWSVAHLKHQNHVDFKPVYLVFASQADARSFSINWSVHAANYPELLTGQIHVVVS